MSPPVAAQISAIALMKEIFVARKASADVWYLVAPASGMASIAVTFSGSVSALGAAISYSSVSQSSPFRTRRDSPALRPPIRR
jgi:hypothetical protein